MKEVYLDGAANTPLDKKVLKKMKPYLNNNFVGNSSSIHNFGVRAAQAVEYARMQVAQATCSLPEEIFFTSGATEGNNWIIKSVADEQLANGMTRPKIVCSALEHSSVLNACKALIPLGFNVVFVKPKNGRSICFQDVKNFIDEKTCLVCVMLVNNETGVVNRDVDKIAIYAKEKGAITLTDCTQAMSGGSEDTEICIHCPNVDCFTFSAHKFYGPTGVGCAIIRKNVKIIPFLKGGAQERGFRGGTTNTAGIVGLGAAIEQMHNNDYHAQIKKLYTYFLAQLREGMRVNVSRLETFYYRHFNIISLNCSGYCHTDNLASVLATYDIAVSAGSACDADHDDTVNFNPSHVLSAMGLTEKDIRNTIRVSFTKYTTKKDIDRLFKALDDIHELTVGIKE